MNKLISRRQALRQLALGLGTLIFFGACSSTKKITPLLSSDDKEWLELYSPIDRNTNSVPLPEQFFGDNPERAHQALWDKETFISDLGELPNSGKKVRIVIIGGGMSGLASAYYLRQFQPVVLEQAARFGGNSKAMSWQGIPYSIGAAYFEKPDNGDPLDVLLDELNLKKEVRYAQESMAIFQGQKWPDFWSGKHTPSEKKIQQTLKQYIKKLRFPEIPTQQQDMRDYVNSLDRFSLQTHLENYLGVDLPPKTASFIEQYCWSSFAGSMNEISAAAGLNFLATEFAPLGVLPGGNARMAEALLTTLAKELPSQNLKTGSLVFDVREEKEAIHISYMNQDGEAQSISCDICIFACPKFVATKIWSQMDLDRVNAIGGLRYRSYLVANALFEGNPKHDHYETFYLGDKPGELDNIEIDSARNRTTDVINANFTSGQVKGKSVFTMYRAIPYDGARPMLLAEDSYGKLKADFSLDVEQKIRGHLIDKQAVLKDLQLTRWGHPIPLAEIGLYREKIVDILHRPHNNRLFFIEQDNWMQPAIETAVHEAHHWSKIIKKILSA